MTLDWSVIFRSAGAATTVFGVIGLSIAFVARRSETHAIVSLRDFLGLDKGLTGKQMTELARGVLKEKSLSESQKTELITHVLKGRADGQEIISAVEKNRDLAQLMKMQLDLNLKSLGYLVVCSVLLSVLGLVAMAVPGPSKLNPVPDSALTDEKGRKLADVLSAEVDPDQWVAYERTADFKAKPFLLRDVCAEQVTTVFFEVPVTNGNPSEKCGYVKVQAIQYPRDAHGIAYLRPYSSSSSGESKLNQELMLFRGTNFVKNVRDIHPVEDHVVAEVQIGPETLVGFVTTYPNECLLMGKVRDQPRDWLAVEVTDLAPTNAGSIAYTFLIGSVNRPIQIARTYDVFGVPGRLRFRERPCPDLPDAEVKRQAFGQLRPVLQHIADNWTTPYRDAFKYLADETNFMKLNWVGEALKSCKADALYITQ